MRIPAAGMIGAAGRRAVALAGPVTDVVLRPPLLAERYQPASVLATLARRGSHGRDELLRDLSDLLDLVVPALVTEVLRRVDLTETARRYLDLDSLVEGVDVDAVAARLDLDRVVDRLDLNRIVRERVDLDSLVATVDLDAAAARLDVDAVARRLDLEAVIDRIDVVGLAEEVIAEVDLPEIIRESTGSVASDAVRGVRMQGISGDEAVGRAIDRLRHVRARHAAALSDAPVQAPSLPRQAERGAPREP
ncbi:MAG: hypothetical protein ACXVYW_09390 [Oryzihumus sp.]